MTDRPSVCSPDTAFYEMVVRYLDNRLDAEELSRLEARLADDDGSCDALLDVCLQMALIAETPAECIMSLGEGDNAPATDGNLQTAWEAPAGRAEWTADAEPRSESLPNPRSLGALPTTIYAPTGYFSSSWPVAYLVATVICGVGLVVGSLVHVSRPLQVATDSFSLRVEKGQPSIDTRSTVVGRVTGMADCEWSDPKTEAHLGARVPLGRKYGLSSGLMEITYDTGAKVILQGPVSYEVESPAGGYLSIGKLTTKVEKRSEVRGQRSESANQKSSDLFAIRTPTAVITDLGTEFGVEVGKDGNTTSHVFRGTVKVEWSDARSKIGNTLVLHEDESLRIENGQGGQGLMARRITILPGAYVRHMDSRPVVIDLLDIVAGGSGEGRHRERGIDPCTGMQDPTFLGTNRIGDRAYHRTQYFPMIDGVFVPEGSQGPVVIDSAGHTFGFPKTHGNSVGPIWARAVDVRPQPRETNTEYIWIYEPDFAERFMPERRGLLTMHANVGITFDLDAIRSAHRGRQLDRFRATVGKRLESLADVWVFVDGALKWQALQIRASSGTSQVDLAIRRGDRFLTLVVTDGEHGGVDGIGGDQAVFGDPVLETVISEAE